MNTKLKNAGKRTEQGHASRGARGQNEGPVSGRPNDESSSTIHAKHFGHVIKTTNALHGSDPYKASHKL